MILITGKNGQLATDLEDVLSKEGIPYRAYSKEEWDISSQEDCEKHLKEDCKILINTAAFTKVDNAETDEVTANRINALGVRNLAIHCNEKNIKLIHISTDFLFSGVISDDSSEPRFWKPRDIPKPVGIYAKSKHRGELEIIHRMIPNQYHIIRTSWLYSHHNHNFVRTILRLLSEETRSELSVIEDQIGRPTYAYRLAEFILLILLKLNTFEILPNVIHFSNKGIASWFDFACEIQRIAIQKGILHKKIPLHPIATEKYPTPAKRPKFSVLNLEKTLEMHPTIPHWRDDLELCMEKIEI